jgi:hypothetical protein
LDLRHLDQKLSSALAILALNSLDIRDRVAGAYVHALADLVDEQPPPGIAASWRMVFGPLAPISRPPAGGAISQRLIRSAIGQLPHQQLLQIEDGIRSLAQAVSAGARGTAKTADRREARDASPGAESTNRPPPLAVPEWRRPKA